MTTNSTAAQLKLVLCSVIASTAFATIAADLRSESRIGRAGGEAAPSTSPEAARKDVPAIQTWAEITNLPDAGVNTGG